MKYKSTGLYAVLSLLNCGCFYHTAAYAEVAQSATDKNNNTVTTATIPNSNENYLDDRLTWPTAIIAKSSLNGEMSDAYCIPANTRLVGAKSTMDVTTTIPNGSTTGTASQFQSVYLDVNSPWFDIFKDKNIKVDAKSNTKYVQGPSKDQVPNACPGVDQPDSKFYEGTIAYVSSEDMENALRVGWDYGAFVVPFKMQLSGAKSFTGSSSVGGYFGYKFPLFNTGLAFSPILFAGASNISTSATTDGKTNSQTVAGLSYGGGLITSIKDNFQIGLILGFDHVDSAQQYQYNDKPWISFEVGYSFAQ